MIPETIPSMLAAEHRRALRAEADVFRAARQARALHPAPRSPLQQLLMRSAVATMRIRPIARTDAARIRAGFERLSAESRRLRFLAPKHSLTEAEVRFFTDVDHHDHEALVAASRWTGQGMGVARYVRFRDDPQAADLAVTVLDEWQGLGVGTALVQALDRRARCEGVTRFIATMSTDNVRSRRLLDKLPGTVNLLERDGTTMTYEIRLARETVVEQRQLRHVLQQAPAGC